MSVMDETSKKAEKSSESDLIRGNALLREGNYKDALRFFEKAKIQMPLLKKSIDFNISYINKKLGIKNFVTNEFSNLSENEFNILTLIRNYKEKNSSYKPKLAVYTCISGGYDSLITPENLNPEWDYILFTDANLVGESNYQIRNLPHFDNDPVRMARFVKLNPHIVLSDYDYSIWIDGNVLLKNNGFFAYVNELINSDYEICFRKHPDRNCVYEEILKCQELNKDDFGIMQYQTNRYLNFGFAKDLGLYETNVIFRKHTDKIKEFNSTWWNELANGSRRDQLSVSYALNLSKPKFTLFDQDISIRDPLNPWFYIFSHSPANNKNANKYSQPSFYKLELSSKNHNDSYFNFNTYMNRYSNYKIPHQVQKVINDARSRGDFDNYFDELDIIQERNQKLKIDITWQKILHLYLSGDVEKAKVLLSELDDVAINDDIKFYVQIFKYEINSGSCEDLKIKNLNDSDNAEFYCASMKSAKNDLDKIEFLNKIFKIYGLQNVRGFNFSGNGITIDSVFPAKPIHRHHFDKSLPLVTVIIPAYNASSTIRTTIYSLMSQTWTNLEIIVVDDNSSDNTCEIVEELNRYDKRIKLIKNKSNNGPYVLRNMALNVCNGEFVTVADADDWNHPDKIRIQVTHLLNNKDIVANVACWIRMESDLTPVRRGNPFYKHLNISSLMFRAKQIEEKIGYWLEVRFGGDSEFYKRLIAVFGRAAVIELDAVTSIGRVEKGSLTNSQLFGYFGYPYGARKEYLEIYDAFHRLVPVTNFKYSKSVRQFPIPKPMDPNVVDMYSKFKLVFIGDFRLKHVAELLLGEIEKILLAQTSFCIVQMNSSNIDPKSRVDIKLRDYLNEKFISFTVYGENVEANEAVVFEPDIIESKNNYLPNLKVNNIKLIHTLHSVQRNSFLPVDNGKKWNLFLDAPVEHCFLDELTETKCKEKNEFFNSSVNALNFKVLKPNLIKVRTSEINKFVYSGSTIHCVVMPCIDMQLGERTAEILINRAGINLTVIIAFDDLRQGFIKTLNEVSKRVNSRFITFVAQDAFPGREWLKIAHDCIEESKAGLLAFNDGKWFGRIASFGLVRKSWVKNIYSEEILCSAYKSHKADNEITVIARLDDSFVYCPDSVLLEIDYDKDSGGSNSQDNLIFQSRFNNGFSVFSENSVNTLRKEYKVKVV